VYFFFQAEDGIRDFHVTGVQTCALPISETQRQAILNAFEQAPSAADWKQLETRLHQDKIPVRLQQAQARPSLLAPRLRNLVQNRSEERRVGKECRTRWSQKH